MHVHSSSVTVMTDDEAPKASSSSSSKATEKRRPGRPPTYVFSKPDAELSENERRLKGAVIKRRLRQNRSYHRKKRLKELADQAAKSAAAAAASSADVPVSVPPASFAGANLPPVSLPAASLPIASHSFPNSQGVPLPILSPLPVFSAGTSAYSSPPTQGSLPDSSLTYLSQNVRREMGATTHVTVSTTAGPVSTSELPVPTSIFGTGLDATGSPEQLLNTTYFSPMPRFDGSMIQGPTSNVEVRVENSGGIPFLSIGAPRRSPKQKGGRTISDEGDEAQLLEEILDSSHQRPSGSIISNVPRAGGVRPFLSQDMDGRLSSLPKNAIEGLKHLVLFPASFSPESALHIMGLKPDDSLPTDIFKPLVELKLLRVLPSGRYELNDITKSLVANDSFEDAREARQRFVSHFMSKLRALDPNSLSRKGVQRFKAMKIYDAESKNFNIAQQMCRDIGGKRLSCDFLAQAASVMRYSICAFERTQIFEQVLKDPDAHGQTNARCCQNEPRIRLALAEAFFDLLAFDKAEAHLRSAIGMMARNEGGSLPVSSSVLALLLLAELRISDQDFDEAKKLLVQALKSLNEADLQKSTFAVCCLLSLASVYMSTKQFESAVHSVNAGLEILTDLGFSQMPIYADALGTLGMVHFRKGELEQAQTLFYSALNIIQTWMSKKEWESAPFQHCTHLDIFLVEYVAHTYVAQNRHQEAGQLFERARQQRQERRLAVVEPVNLMEGEDIRGRFRLYTRHLY